VYILSSAKSLKRRAIDARQKKGETTVSTPAQPAAAGGTAGKVANVILQILSGGNLILASVPLALEFAMEIKKIFDRSPDYTTNIVQLTDSADQANASALEIIAAWQTAHGFPVTVAPGSAGPVSSAPPVTDSKP
jgi:hypothetical protein